MNEITEMFRYASGEIVCEHDEVLSSGHRGRVSRVCLPRTDSARDLACYESGGVLIEEDWENAVNRILFTPPDGESWEDLKYIRRGKP
jgi:hypothetical protein